MVSSRSGNSTNLVKMSLYLLILLMVVTPVDSVWCFICNSEHDSDCGDDFKGEAKLDFRQECIISGGTCIKRRGKRSYSEGVRRVVVDRSCVPFQEERCFDENLHGISYYSCTCNENYCNAGRDQRSSKLLLVGLSVLSGLYLLMRFR